MVPAVPFSPCPEALWLRLCAEDLSCTFYQTPAWLQLAAEHFQARGEAGVEVAPWSFSLPEGPAVFPLLRRRRFGSWHYFSPFGTYSAPVFAGTLSDAGKAAIAASLRRVNVLLTSSPFSPNAVQIGRPLDFAIQAVDLLALDPENPMRDWEEGQQRRVRVSRRSGVTVRAAQGEADWRRYYALYQESLERWGDAATAHYPWSLFEALRRLSESHAGVTLWLAETPAATLRQAGLPTQGENPEISAGYLTFYHQRHAVPWHGAGGKAYFRFGVTQALFHHMMADAQRRGFVHFDLTGSSGLGGVASFKSRFGTRDIAFQGSLHQVGLYGVLARLRASWRGNSKRLAPGGSGGEAEPT